MAYIDRNPEEMIRFAKDATNHILNMENMASTLHSMLSNFESELDDNCKGAIRKLGEDVKAYKSQVETVKTSAEAIGKKGKNQSEAGDIFKRSMR